MISAMKVVLLRFLAMLIGEVAFTGFLLGLLVWGYIVGVNLVHPEWLPLPLTHYVDAPVLGWRTDDVGIFSFIIAGFSLTIWRISIAVSSTLSLIEKDSE